nr:unnamed protein product [Callosobruchus analis]
MLPTNVMSFMKKMVATEPGPATAEVEGGMTFEKIKQTLSSSLLTAQDKVTNKMSPRPSIVPLDSGDSPTSDAVTGTATVAPKAEAPPKDPPRGNCRVCLKAFRGHQLDQARSCAECSQRVCEDCASYSKMDNGEDTSNWTCSVCRRKMQSRTVLSQDSNESLLEIPIQELQRRHSETRLGSSSAGSDGLSVGGFGGGLAPPRSPELRRHSDLKSGKPSSDHSTNKPLKPLGSPYGSTADVGPPPVQRSRRGSRVSRQRSYDEEVKAAKGIPPGSPATGPDGSAPGLGLPAPMPRRASAYDVFAGAPGGLPAVAGPPMGRRASFRIAPPTPVEQQSPPTENDSPSGVPLIAAGLVGGGAVPSIEERRMSCRRASHMPLPALEDLEAAPRRQASVDAEGIRIVIHDVDSGATTGVQKRVLLKKDPNDKTHRTRGFGMRVVGGKTAADGRLFAYIVWTVPSGPAEKGGLQQGDKEQIAAAQAASREQQQQQLLHQQQPQGITGRIQIQVWYHDERKELVVAVLAADDLAPRDETLGFGNLPEAYARLSLVPKTSEDHCVQTEVAPASRNPIWNANLSFPNVAPEELAERQLEIALWDLVPRTEHSFLGGCAVDLQKAFLDDRAVWCRLDAWPPPNSMQGGRSPHTSPRGSIVSGGIDKRGDFGNQRSVSDDVDSIGECASLLHPDRAWGSRRGSSQSEQLETEVYELGKDFSRSLPGSRRSSFQSIQEQQQKFKNENTMTELQQMKNVKDGFIDFTAGSLGGITLVYVGQPLDTVKVKMQTFPTLYTNMFQCFIKTLKTDGIAKGLYAGTVPALVTNITENSVLFVCYGLCQKFMQKITGRHSVDELSVVNNATAGFLASFFSSIAICPTELVKCKLQAMRELGKQNGCAQVGPYTLTCSILKNEGMKGMFRGLVPTLAREMPGYFFFLEDMKEEKPAVPPPPSYSRDRRRSSCTRMLRDPEEILKSLKAVKGELGRTMSLTGDKKHRKSASGPGEDCKEDSLEMSEAGREGASPPSSPERASPPQLGPGQIKPKGYRFSTSQPPEIKLGLVMTKGRDQERWLQKKKTRIAKHSYEPQFRQTLKYQACDILGRSLVVMLWERQGGFEHNQGLGGAEVALDALTLTHLTTGWYPLFPIQFLGSDSNDSP